jgi:hypothetical protein
MMKIVVIALSVIALCHANTAANLDSMVDDAVLTTDESPRASDH